MKHSIGFLVLLLTLGAAPITLRAAAPANDSFAGRLALSGAVVTTAGNSVEATAEAGEPLHWNSNGGHSLWWSWTPAVSGSVTIVTAGSEFDTILAVYTGAAVNALTAVASNDDDALLGSTTSRVQFNATAGTTYHIAVDGFGSFPNGSTGSVTLNIAGAIASTPVTLIATGAVWKYLDDGTDQGTAWRGTNFNDSAWASGPAELGYGDLTDGRPEATVLCCSNAATKFITYYFRRAIIVTNAANITALTVQLLRDDGGVVYLNETEVFRSNLPGGPITSTTPASSSVGGSDEFAWFSSSVNSALLREGTNLIAVEIHQSGASSSDVSFNLELTGTRVGSNAVPVVTLTAPAPNTISAAPAVFNFTATASDPDGGIGRVDFYANTTLVGSDVSNPYAFSWGGVSAGTYTLRAVALDIFGVSGTSAPVSVTVTGNIPPFASLTLPADGAAFTAPASLTLEADAIDLDGTITNVEFYQGTVRIGQDATSPFAFSTNGVSIGSYVYRVVATDNSGARGTSAVVNVTVNPNTFPAVSLTNPPNNTTLTAPASLTLAANATDLEGPVASVAFYAGPNLLGTDTTGPFTFDWSGIGTGAYALRAIATDAGGLSTTSAVVNLLVEAGGSTLVLTNILVAGGSAGWKYLDNNTDQGTSWRSLAFDDSSWSNGVTQIGFGDGDEATTIASLQQPTVYFRRAFLVNNPATYTNLHVTLLRDDGGVVYLNGTEILRSPTLPSGQTFITLAANSADNSVDTTNASFALPQLLDGTNYIAVEIHQSSLNSSDLSMDLQLVGISVITTGSNPPPSVAITSPAPGANFNPPPATIPIDATASDPGGSVSKVEFYAAGVKVGEDLSSPYNYTHSGVGAGSYALTAVATDNLGARATSAPVNITVTGVANQPPVVALTNPPAGTYSVPGNFLLQASATDPGGSVSKVEFFQAGFKIGEDTTAPYTYDWANNQAGTFAMTAVATDNLGLLGTSAPVSLTFTGLGPVTLIATGADWKYLDDGTDQGTAWTLTGFDDAAWASGPAELGYGDGDEATVVSFGPSAGNKYVTTYFRRAFTVANPGAFTFLSLRLKRDDGAAVYLNGSEIFRNSLAGGANYQTFAVNAGDDGAIFLDGTASAALLVPGMNVIAVEIHQATASSSDISFDFELIGNTGVIVNDPPSVTITSPPNNSTYTEPANVQITAGAADSDGTVGKVEFFVGGTKIGEDTSAPFAFTYSSAPLGNYALTAIATDNLGATATSSVVNVFVTASTAPELVSRLPAPGTVGSLSQITVQFSEPVDGVTADDLLINNLPAASVSGSNANYTFSFPQPMDGVIGVRFAANTAIADRESPPKPFDASATNASWSYTLADNIAPTVLAIDPQPGAVLASFRTVEVTFSENVGGVNASDLRRNGAGATALTGSGAGPYKFTFNQPATNGPVTMVWTNNHGIRDFAAVPNLFAGGTWSYTLNTNVVQTNIVISEVMYHPLHNQAAFVPEPVLEEYVELFNRGATAVNLNGWRLSGGVTYTFTNLTLNAGAYVVVAAHLPTFQAKYPGITNVVGPFSGRLSNTEDDLDLDDPLGNNRDSVHYADSGDWAPRRQVPDENGSGQLSWDWNSPADGQGASLELIQAALPNQYGQNWTASPVNNGTPGRTNSVATNNVAPFILGVSHAPVIPSSTLPITISARLLDEQTSGLGATLFWRIASVPTTGELLPFTSTSMLDNALHGDGLAGDGVFGATLPAQPNLTVIEYYVLSTDPGGRTRTWPAPTDAVGTQGANALLQVDDGAYPGPQPVFRLIMTGPENQRLANLNRTQPGANVNVNATFITSDGVQTQLRHLIGVRHRGAGSRGAQPPNLRLAFPRDQKWNNVGAINLNSLYTHSQVSGSVLGQRAGLASEEAVAVQVRRNGTNAASANSPQFGSFVWLESRDSVWTANHYPEDPNGNLYSATRPNGGLAALGSYTSAAIQSAGYQKDSNQSENDYSDIADLIQVLNNTPDAQYPAAVRQRLNAEQWLRHLAVLSLLGYGETSIGGDGAPDDYTLYRGVNDPRFVLIPHDHDTDLGQGDGSRQSPFNSVFRAADGNSVINRFLRHPEFVPLYYQELKFQLENNFRPAAVSAVFDQIFNGWPVAAQTIFNMKDWMTNRAANVWAQIPTNFTVTVALPVVSGYFQTTTGTAALSGQANAIETRSVRVNGQIANWSAWQGTWSLNVTLTPGLNRVVVQTLDGSGLVLRESTVDIWSDDGSTANLAGAITGTQTLTASGGPYIVSANVTIGNGATLVIPPGTSLYLNSGVTINVTGTGRLLAEGTESQRIRFTRAPGSAGNWGSIDFVNASLESRVAYADIEFCGGTTLGGHNAMMHVNGARVFLDHLVFTNTPAVEYISFDNSSFIVQHSVFPTYPFATSAPEMLHGVNGIPANGYGIFRDNYFGHTYGFNDTIDFTGGQRPGAILQIINNVFDGAGDDHLDLDSTDAWIEGNIFLHAHRDTNRTDNALDTASAISGGTDVANQLSEWTILNNLFYDVDHAVLNKQGGRFLFVNNTVVRVTKGDGSGLTNDIAVLNLNDNALPLPAITLGAGAYVSGNIIWDAPMLVANYNSTNHVVRFENNLLPMAWTGPGTNNVVADPLLNLSLITDPATADWRTVKAALTPKPGSPALGTGVGGYDKGGMNPPGLLIFGEPSGFTPLTTATLTVAPGGSFHGGTTTPPYVWGYTHYQWKLDDGPWSAELSITNSPTISLSGLSAGPHSVSVIGRNDAGHYQNDPLVYPADAGIPGRATVSRTWIVNGLKSPVLFNEVLAANVAAVPVSVTKFPDLVELYNPGTNAVSLAGMGLTDEADRPFKFTFPAGASIAARQHLVLYADSDATPAGFHLGFSLQQEGEALFLTASNGMTLDSITFGAQLTDRSIGRGADGVWRLNQPTLGAANVALPTGDVHALKINEWLASGLTPFPDDFIELFNPGALPVDLGALFLTDNPIGAPFLHDLTPLSFIPAGGYAVYLADGNTGAGANHVGFKLRAEQGMIGLLAADGAIIDCVIYGPQTTDVAMGRQPNGTGTFGFFTPPTPNPSLKGGNQTLVINEVLAWNILKKTPDGSTPDWVEIYNATTNAISLADMSLSDNPALARKFVFPAGLTVPALGFFSLRLDPDLPSGPTNAGFGLKSTGQALYLFDTLASGGGQLSAVSFGVQAADFSIGRVPNGSTNWVLCIESIGFGNSAVVLGDVANVRVNEWMADPAGGDDWFELFNPNAQPVALGGLHLSDRLDTPANRMKHRIAPLSFLGTAGWAYQRFEADGVIANGPDHVNFSLARGGEQVGLSSAAGALLDGVTFGAQSVGIAQGRLPDGSTNTANFPGTDSPGDPNYVRLASVAIHEALAHTDAPQEDAIEVRNLTGTNVNIGGWFLSDAKHALKKFRIPLGTVLPANGFKVFYEYQFNDTNLNPATAFSLSSAKGDEIYLGEATTNELLTGFRAQVDFGASENGVSFGRYVTSVGEAHFVAMSARTFGVDDAETPAEFRMGTGLPNAYPKVGPIVIGEIMYHPPDQGTNDDTIHEFIELRNLTAQTQPLYHPLFPTNAWRLKDAVSFTFPPATTITPNGYLIVVSFDPTNTAQLNEFRSYHNMSASTAVVGPWNGKLDNGGESIELTKPDAPQPDGDVPQVLVERVKYSDLPPWPTNLVDGGGFSLQRANLDEYGNDPINWTTAAPNPGPAAGNPDSDGDGMPDLWELLYGLSVGVNDAASDLDGDGASNLNEYLSGTVPNDPNSFLRLMIVGAGPAVLQFNAGDGRTYTIEYKNTLNAPSWSKLTDVPAGVARLVQVPDPSATPTRFYRLRTPQSP